MQQMMPLGAPEPDHNSLHVVYARFERAEPFSFDLFVGFTSLRVLTYSASVGMIFRLLNQFEQLECIFGYEGVIQDFTTILGFQKALCDSLHTAVLGLDDTRKGFILQKISEGKARLLVVKDAIAHSKIYLLESPTRRRVIVGSANLSERAFSGKQAETILVFDNDDAAWQHYTYEYEVVRGGATNEVALDTILQAEIVVEDLPVLQAACAATSGITIYTHTDPQAEAVRVPSVLRAVERFTSTYHAVIQPVLKPRHGQVQINREVVGKIVHQVKNQKRDTPEREPIWFSINRETHKVLLAGKEYPLAADPVQVQSDVACLIDYFENFKQGFYGDVAQHQRDYFMFTSWFYFSPFICDLRNQAIKDRQYIFDYPLFAILYGKSNCGKTSLIQTVMRSMFGDWTIEEKTTFTRTYLRDLLVNRRRFPVVFDDVEKRRFDDHAIDLIKDETFVYPEYPAFVLSMNAEDQSFASEIRKRCLVLYTRTSLPDHSAAAKQLYGSIRDIQRRMTTALYREYLHRMLVRLDPEPVALDLLALSSGILVGIMREASPGPLPAWCTMISIAEYQSRKHEKIRAELVKLHQTNGQAWDVRRDEVILKVQSFESHVLRREIPDWLIKEGSKGGNIVLDRAPLEEFLGISFGRRWRLPFRR